MKIFGIRYLPVPDNAPAPPALRVGLRPAGAVSLLLALGLTVTFTRGIAVAGERALNKSILVTAPPTLVWNAWTTRQGVRTWMAPDAEVEARVDGPFRIFFDPAAPEGRRGADDMRFLSLQPPRMLSFDWNAPIDWPAVRAQRTVVIVRLAAVREGTRVNLHHVGWGEGEDWDAVYRFFDVGWDRVLRRLRQRFIDGPIKW